MSKENDKLTLELGRMQGIFAAAVWLKKQSKITNNAHALAIKMLREFETIVANVENETKLDALRGDA